MSVPSRTRWTAVALVASAILVVSAIPIPESVPEEGGSIPTSVPFHFLGYATLAVSVEVALLARTDRARSALTAPLVTSTYGVLIECLQYPIPYRSFSYFDMLVNATGATCGTVALIALLALSDDHR